MVKKRRVPAAEGRKKTIVYLNGTAAFCMFLAWVGQNVYQSDATSRLDDARRDVQFVNSVMPSAQGWLLAYQTEIRKDRPDTEVLVNTAMSYARVTGTIVEAAQRVDPESTVLREQMEKHREYMQGLDQASSKHNIKEFESESTALMSWFGLIGPAAAEAMNAGVQKDSTQEGVAKWGFRGFFLIASTLFAFTWWETNIRSPQS